LKWDKPPEDDGWFCGWTVDDFRGYNIYVYNNNKEVTKKYIDPSTKKTTIFLKDTGYYNIKIESIYQSYWCGILISTSWTSKASELWLYVDRR